MKTSNENTPVIKEISSILADGYLRLKEISGARQSAVPDGCGDSQNEE